MYLSTRYITCRSLGRLWTLTSNKCHIKTWQLYSVSCFLKVVQPKFPSTCTVLNEDSGKETQLIPSYAVLLKVKKYVCKIWKSCIMYIICISSFSCPLHTHCSSNPVVISIVFCFLSSSVHSNLLLIFYFIFHFCLVLLISVHISSAHHNPIYNTNNSLKWRAWFVAHVDDFSGVVFSEHYSLIVKSSLNFQTKSVQSSYTSELFKSPRMWQTVCSVNFPL